MSIFFWFLRGYEKAKLFWIRRTRKSYMTVTDRGAIIFHWHEFYKDHPEAFKREQENIKRFFKEHGSK